MSDPAAAENSGAMQRLVATYIQLRDIKADIANKAKAKIEKVDAQMDKIEGLLLAQFTSLGIDSVKTEKGTAFVTTKTGAKVADWDAALQFIVENEHWSMLERRVSKDFVAQYRQESGGDLPPGIDWFEERAVNVRRPSK